VAKLDRPGFPPVFPARPGGRAAEEGGSCCSLRATTWSERRPPACLHGVAYPRAARRTGSCCPASWSTPRESGASPGWSAGAGDGLSGDGRSAAGETNAARLTRNLPRSPHGGVGRPAFPADFDARGLPIHLTRCQGKAWKPVAPRQVDRRARRFGTAPALPNNWSGLYRLARSPQTPGRVRSRRPPAGCRRARDAGTDCSRCRSGDGRHGVGRPPWGALRGPGRRGPPRRLRTLGRAPGLRRRLHPGRRRARAAGVHSVGRLG
jgi:hypothetical protein